MKTKKRKERMEITEDKRFGVKKGVGLYGSSEASKTSNISGDSRQSKCSKSDNN